jgi:hypothetical protein
VGLTRYLERDEEEAIAKSNIVKNRTCQAGGLSGSDAEPDDDEASQI